MKYKLINFWEVIRYGLPRFIRNAWTFRKALWDFNWYDSHGVMVFNQTALTLMANKTEKHGIEVDRSRLKKVAKMRRAAQLYQNFITDNFIDQAEKELGDLILHPIKFEELEDRSGHYRLVSNESPEERAHNRKVYDRAREIEEVQWAELHAILKGLDYTKYKPGEEDWDDFYDGSDMRSWWD